MDDDRVKRAEQLLHERAKKTNGHTKTTTEAPPASTEEVEGGSGAETSRSDTEALTNDLKRLAADFANYRKRNEAERAEFAKFAKAELIRKLLDVLDGYDRAIEAVPSDLAAQPWVEGMWLVERKLRSILEAEGLTPIESLGTPFDPYLHQAVAHVESDEPEGTVIEEHQKAYRLHDRVIRPALVTVSKGRARITQDA